MACLAVGALALVVPQHSAVGVTAVQRSSAAQMMQRTSTPAFTLMEAMVDLVDDLAVVEGAKRLDLLTPLAAAAEARWEREMARKIAALENELAEKQAEADALRAQLLASESQVHLLHRLHPNLARLHAATSAAAWPTLTRWSLVARPHALHRSPT